MNVKYIQTMAWMGLGMMALIGCSGEEVDPRYPVSGTVSIMGAPVEGAIVAFTPEGGGLPASGTTDADGKYQLTTRVNGDGALPGKYLVSIAKYQSTLDSPETTPEAESESSDPYDITNEYPTGYDELEESEIAASISKNLLPPKYAIPQRSGLTAAVEESENSFDFELK